MCLATNTYRLPVFAAGTLIIYLLTGCSTTNKLSKETSRQTRDAIVAAARTALGAPYRYGGQGLNGFDCSGLTQYAHRAVGLGIPRTTHEQYRHAHYIALKDLQPGDLVFFRTGWWKVSHVGIYAGDGWFIHAPATGRKVSLEQLAAPYWQRRIRKDHCRSVLGS